MEIEWHDLLTGIGLLLVFEGIFPFALPSVWRNWLANLISQSNTSIRVMGLVSMLMGALVLHFIY